MSSEPFGVWRSSREAGDFSPEMARVGFDDSNWMPLNPPWLPEGEIGGSLVIRRELESGHIDRHRRVWLQLEGVPGRADVWIDGTLAGEIDCEHAPYLFEVPQGHARHAVALEVTGQGSAWPDGRADMDGVEEPMRLLTTGNAALTRFKMTCPEANAEHAILHLHGQVDSTTSGRIEIRTYVRRCGSERIEATHHVERSVAAGRNRVRWAISVERPDLWWPHALGDQSLYDVSVEVIDIETNEVSDARTLRTGLRSVSIDKWTTLVNGESMFVKGVLLPASASSDDALGFVSRCRDADVDLVYLRDGAQRHELYETADRLGVMIWQQLPLAGRERSRKRHERLARQVIDTLAHRPSVIAWTRDQHLLSAWPPFSDSQRRLIERTDPTRPILMPPQPFDLTKLRTKNDRFVAIAGNADEVTEQIDRARSRKYRPAQGVLVWRHVDTAFPALSSVRLVAGNVEVDDDDRLAIHVYLVNDTRQAASGVHVQGTLRWQREQPDWQWEGDMQADSAAHVGIMRFPAVEVGTALEIELEAIDKTGAILTRSLVTRRA